VSVLARLRIFIILVGAGGAGGFLGSVLGAAFNRQSLFIGGIIGGLVVSPVAAWLCGRVGWLEPHEVRGTALGAALGFAAAVFVAVNTLSSPIGPLLSPLLVGIGGLVGRRLGSGQRRDVQGGS